MTAAKRKQSSRHPCRDLRTASGPIFPEAIRDNANRADGIYFHGRDQSPKYYSYAKLADEMDRRAKAFLALGAKPGDRIGFIIPDPEEFVLNFVAALAAGVVPVPMYPPLSFGRLDAYIQQASTILNAADARFVLTDNSVQKIAWGLVDQVTSLERLVTTDELAEASRSTLFTQLPTIEVDDVAFLQFTSGSTSSPKGVVVSHRCLLSNLHAIMNDGLAIVPDDVAVSWLPLYHDMGLIGFVLAPLWYSVPTHYIPTLDFVKRPSLWMETMSKVRGTIAFAPNFALALAVRRTSPEKVATLDLSCIKALGCGAELNRRETLESFIKHFAPAGFAPEALMPAYGMAEATLAISFDRLDRPFSVDRIDAEAYHAGNCAKKVSKNSEQNALEFVSCGRPLEGTEIDIVSDEGRVLAEREIGEIRIKSDGIAPGYFGEASSTQDTFTPEGLLTGDLGYLADGDVFVTGRKKDLIIIHGRNYDPQSIEWCAMEVEGVRKGNVIAFAFEKNGEEGVVLVAETRAEDKEELADLIAATVREDIGIALLDVVLVGPGALPKTSSGKLQRQKTKSQYQNNSLATEGDRRLGSSASMSIVARHVLRSAFSYGQYQLKTRVFRPLRHGIKKGMSLVGS